METNTLLLMGFGLYALSRSSQTGNQNNGGSNGNQVDTSYIQTIGPPPVSNTPAWADWVATAINIYGVVAPLWAPGGPLHNSGISQQDAYLIYDEVNNPSGNNGGIIYDPYGGSTIDNGSGTGDVRLGFVI